MKPLIVLINSAVNKTQKIYCKGRIGRIPILLFAVLFYRPVKTAREVIDYVTFGMRHRHADSTKVHAHSSRSHLIVQLNLLQSNLSVSPLQQAATGSDDRTTASSSSSSVVGSVVKSKQQQTSSIPVRSR